MALKGMISRKHHLPPYPQHQESTPSPQLMPISYSQQSPKTLMIFLAQKKKKKILQQSSRIPIRLNNKWAPVEDTASKGLIPREKNLFPPLNLKSPHSPHNLNRTPPLRTFKCYRAMKSKIKIRVPHRQPIFLSPLLNKKLRLE